MRGETKKVSGNYVLLCFVGRYVRGYVHPYVVLSFDINVRKYSSLCCVVCKIGVENKCVLAFESHTDIVFKIFLFFFVAIFYCVSRGCTCITSNTYIIHIFDMCHSCFFFHGFETLRKESQILQVCLIACFGLNSGQ